MKRRMTISAGALALIAALTSGCVPMGSHTAEDVDVRPASARVPAPPQVVEQEPVLPAAHDRRAILAMVRVHRRDSAAEWHRRLADAIHDEARAADVDPLLVASIVAKESSFRSRVVSHAGAVGLMQLRPFVARDVARRSGTEWAGTTTLNDPELNVRLGILYFKQLRERFDGDDGKALTAYNYGPTRVSRWVREGKYGGSRYAESILGLYDELSRLRDELGTAPRTASAA